MAKRKSTKSVRRAPIVCRIDPCVIGTIPLKLDQVIERQGQMLTRMAAAQTLAEQQVKTVARHETILSGNGNRGLVRTVERHDAFWAERAQRLTLGTSVWVGAMVALATLLSAVFAWLFRGG